MKSQTSVNLDQSVIDSVLTPPETQITKPIRFTFEPPTEPDLPKVPELELPTKDPIYELLHERIKQLKHENHHLSEVTKCIQ